MADLTIFRLIFLYQILIFSIRSSDKKRTYSENGIPNRLHFHDLGAANEIMFLEAFLEIKQGLIMHEMGGFDVRKAREVFNIPEDYEIGSMIAIGYQDTHTVIPDRLDEKELIPRVRKPLSEIAFIEVLDNPHGISVCSAYSRIL